MTALIVGLVELWYSPQLAPQWPWIVRWQTIEDGRERWVEASAKHVHIDGGRTTTGVQLNERGKVARHVVRVAARRDLGPLRLELASESERDPGRYGVVRVLEQDHSLGL